MHLRVPLRGTTPRHAAGDPVLPAPPRAGRTIAVTIVVRPRCPLRVLARRIRAMASQMPAARTPLDIDEFTRQYGAARADLRRVRAFAERRGLKVIECNAERRAVEASGTLDQLARAFGIEFIEVDTADPTVGSYLSHRGPIRVPAGLRPIVLAVLGLDGRSVTAGPAAAGARRSHPIDPLEIERVYRFPAASSAKGQTVAVIALGGGVDRRDLKAYFKLRRLPMPRVTLVGIHGERNRPARRRDIRRLAAFLTPGRRAPRLTAAALNDRDIARLRNTKWTIEATMDVSLIGTFANGADIVVYFAPDDMRGKYCAVSRALTDRAHQASVISCSYGIDESLLPTPVLRVLDLTYQLAALRGVTVCCASGDQPGALQFPASSPYVLACGGTHLPGPRAVERAWAETIAGQRLATTGGFSRQFATPEWQRRALAASGPRAGGRGVPDVAAKADMAHGYGIIAGGQLIAMGGTSAAAPLWAALVARMNERLGRRIGYLTPLLYHPAVRGAMHHVPVGARRQRARSWNPSTGLGRPEGEALLKALGDDRS